MSKKIIALLGTHVFFEVIVGLFIIEAGWIALSAGYPGIFDENTHLAIIKLYAHQWSPVFSRQPPGSDSLGALTRDPSFLYHYIMSLPYRVLSHWRLKQMDIIICLRFIDITFFSTSLFLFRKTLLKTKVSPALVHCCLLFFILIPIVPFLAAQINYDDLLILLTALCLLLIVTLRDYTRSQHMFHWRLAFCVTAIGMLACTVQFEFLPLFACIEAAIVHDIYRSKKAWPRLTKITNNKKYIRYVHTMKRKDILLVPFFIVSFVLFTRVYLVNTVKYHNPVPACNQVLTTKECMADGTWLRSYEDILHKVPTNTNIIRYSAGWLYRMGEYAFYANSGGSHANDSYVDVTSPPILIVTAISCMVVGLLLALLRGKKLLREHPNLGFLLLITIFYTVVLFIRNYGDFVQTGQKIAINSRYLIPVILPVMVYAILGYRSLLQKKYGLKLGFTFIILLLCLEGGGTLTFIDVSNNGWYWPHDKPALEANQLTQRLVRPFIFH